MNRTRNGMHSHRLEPIPYVGNIDSSVFYSLDIAIELSLLMVWFFVCWFCRMTIIAMGEGKHVDSFHWLKECIRLELWSSSDRLTITPSPSFTYSCNFSNTPKWQNERESTSFLIPSNQRSQPSISEHTPHLHSLSYSINSIPHHPRILTSTLAKTPSPSSTTPSQPHSPPPPPHSKKRPQFPPQTAPKTGIHQFHSLLPVRRQYACIEASIRSNRANSCSPRCLHNPNPIHHSRVCNALGEDSRTNRHRQEEWSVGLRPFRVGLRDESHFGYILHLIPNR